MSERTKDWLAGIFCVLMITTAALAISGCASESLKVTGSPEKGVYLVELPGIVGSYRVRVVEIDGCEYLMNTVHNGLDLTHKGNCKFCLERKR